MFEEDIYSIIPQFQAACGQIADYLPDMIEHYNREETNNTVAEIPLVIDIPNILDWWVIAPPEQGTDFKTLRLIELQKAKKLNSRAFDNFVKKEEPRLKNLNGDMYDHYQAMLDSGRDPTNIQITYLPHEISYIYKALMKSNSGFKKLQDAVADSLPNTSLQVFLEPTRDAAHLEDHNAYQFIIHIVSNDDTSLNEKARRRPAPGQRLH